MKNLPSPKTKAKELIEKYCNNILEMNVFEAQVCAIIAVDEIIENCQNEKVLVGSNYITTSDYWQSVKNEIDDY